ncbi:MAG: hypothetical protein IPL61_24325 [Myxococcales bacterium]|nr:hypothetical protein [Myxococcales bacterium]
MVRRAVAGLVLSSVFACGGGGGGPAAGDAPPSLLEQCEAVDRAFEQLIAAADHACAGAADCTIVGATARCGCDAWLGDRCEGDPISVAGRAAIETQLAGYRAEWDQLGCARAPDVPRVCDCGPAIIDCVADRCVVVNAVSCFIDAGVVGAP